MTFRREWVTPITAGAFLLVAVTGVLMFFHADTGLNKTAHEWLSWVMLVGVALHVTNNFSLLKTHLRKRRGQLLIGLFALLLALSFIPLGGEKSEPPFMAPMRALALAPLGTLAQVAQVSPEEMQDRLAKAGFAPTSDQQSLRDLVGGDQRKQVEVLGEVLATP